MKLTPLYRWLSVIAIALSVEITSLPLQALTFSQQEVNQAEFIAVARPYGDNKYDLLILRQLPGQRQCWQEQAGTPIMVNPLLLNFDFTDICERSTDSNGYSLRIDGEDLGLDYLLRVVERNGELVLVGTNRRNPSLPEVIVGRTRGLNHGFMKIQLDPGWRFTKRTYGNKVLSHVYLTGDRSRMGGPRTMPTAPTVAPTIAPPPLAAPLTPPSSSSSMMLNPPAIHSPQPPLKEFTFTAPHNTPNRNAPLNIPLPPSPQPQSRNFSPGNSPQIATSTIYPNQPLMTPAPPPLNPTNSPLSPSLTASASRNGNLLPPPPLVPKPVPTSGWGMPNPSNPDLLPDRGRTAPLSTSPDLFPARGGTPSLSPSLSTVPAAMGQSSQSGESYRVLAAAANPMLLEQARSLYPEAFRTTYQGRRVLQVGRFSSRDNAQQAYQMLQSVGLQAIIVP